MSNSSFRVEHLQLKKYVPGHQIKKRNPKVLLLRIFGAREERRQQVNRQKAKVERTLWNCPILTVHPSNRFRPVVSENKTGYFVGPDAIWITASGCHFENILLSGG